MTRELGPIACVSVLAALIGAVPVAGGCEGSFALETEGAYLVSNPEWGGTSGGDGSCGYPGCYESQSLPPIGPDFLGVFWALGSGDPLVGRGDDSGSFASHRWTKHASRQFTQLYHYPAWLTRPLGANYLPGPSPDWSQAGDGCFLHAGATADLDGTECTAVLLGDQFAGLSYLAFLTARVDPAGRFPFPVSSSVPIRLAPFPKPFITATHFSTATLTAPVVPPAGLFLDPACGVTSPVGYRLYIRHVLRGAGEPMDRHRQAWSPAVGGATATGGPIPLEQPAAVSVGCPRGALRDAFIAASFVFDSGFETPYLSANSTRMHCTPCLGTDADADGFCADPSDGSVPDCDDANPAVRPGAVERCNAVDDDCDGLIDEDDRGQDFDGDGVRGACDNCPVDDNRFQDDLDGDAVGDPCDNCPFDSNRGQADLDADTEGDVCDLDDGVIYIRFRSREFVEWQAEVGFATWNSYRGDLAELRHGGPYTQLPGSNALAARSCGLVEPRVQDDLDPEPGQGAFFLTTGVSSEESSLGTSSAGERPNAKSLSVIDSVALACVVRPAANGEHRGLPAMKEPTRAPPSLRARRLSRPAGIKILARSLYGASDRYRDIRGENDHSNAREGGRHDGIPDPRSTHRNPLLAAASDGRSD